MGPRARTPAREHRTPARGFARAARCAPTARAPRDRGHTPAGQGIFCAQVAVAEPVEVGGLEIVGSVDDPQVLRAADLHAGLHESPASPRQVGQRLHHHPLPALARELRPPLHPGSHRGRVRDVDEPAPSTSDQVGSGLGQPVGDIEVPLVVVLVVGPALRGEHLEGGEEQPVDTVRVPAVPPVRRGEGIGVGEPPRRTRPELGDVETSSCCRVEGRDGHREHRTSRRADRGVLVAQQPLGLR